MIRWERKSENYLASLYLTSSIIAFNFFVGIVPLFFVF
ncbi:hypothetical protein LEP1GSC193_3442 [Leptospira alstonii serovar Pingchang str. 80-412]|uniref:Uncharacterized protein n=2 Tax=Leptospira alstonii TaxID=28452 RepID=M6CIX2_9LEPT|nr:hypothetical protein LEP1GSC194_3885 [Leptospira alstonii serovar Sichuan str. 79601]EQA82045.1 hypothetical protein LEP1GSC193_3442 [Leptospira alstonii serovar Pingchang str. 80-412]